MECFQSCPLLLLKRDREPIEINSLFIELNPTETVLKTYKEDKDGRVYSITNLHQYFPTYSY